MELGDVLARVLKVSPLLLEMFNESESGCNQSISAEVARQTALNVVLLMRVVPEARAVGLFLSGHALAPTVPVQVGSQCRRRQEHLNGGVIVAPQSLVRIVNLLQLIKRRETSGKVSRGTYLMCVLRVEKGLGITQQIELRVHYRDTSKLLNEIAYQS